MFTGLVEMIGTIREVRQMRAAVSLLVEPGVADFAVSVGDSVAIDGVCLTVETVQGSSIRFSAVAETLSRTTLRAAVAGRTVNMERALRLSDRLGGHIVQGHVDGVGSILSDRQVGESVERTIRVPEELGVLLAEKGSVTVDGVSLTIARSLAAGIVLALVPHTLRATNIMTKHPGDEVNIECDVLARYIFHLIKHDRDRTSTGPAPASIIDKMERYGF